MSARVTEATLAKIPVRSRRTTKYCGQGVSFIVAPNGERYFVVHANRISEEGWTRSVQRTLGHWPQMSLDDARAHARYYRTLAACGVDIRRSKQEAADLPNDWRAGVKAKIAEVRAYIGEPQRTAALAKVAADEARAIERAARQDAHDIRKKKRAAQTRKVPQPQHTPASRRYPPLTIQDIVTLPWDTDEA